MNKINLREFFNKHQLKIILLKIKYNIKSESILWKIWRKIMIQKVYPYRLWKLGKDYRRYAEVIFKNKIEGTGLRPFYFMIGHSYELILKSFLLTKGIRNIKKEEVWS